MKSIKSSLLRKMVLGYKITSGQKVSRTFKGNTRLQFPHPYTQTRQSEQQLTDALRLPSSEIERIHNEVKQIVTKLLNKPSQEFDITAAKSKIENLERTATVTGAYFVPQIANSILEAREKIRKLEIGGAEDINPVDEVKKQIEELGREKSVLEEAKKTIMGKYYNREIDEASLKSITDNYEQRLVEIGIKIQNWQSELEKLEKEPLLNRKSPREKKEMMASLLETNKLTPIFAPRLEAPQARTPPIIINLSKIFQPQIGKTTPETREPPTPAGGATPVYMISPPPAPSIPKAGGQTTPKILTSEEAQGIEIPQIPKTAKIGSIETEEEKSYISLTYPLIPRFPAKNEHVYAYTKIFWDENNNRYVYNLVEPKLTGKLTEVYHRVKEMLEQKLDIDFSKLKKIEAREFLDKQVDEVLKYFNFVLIENEKRILKYYMGRDFTGLEMIEPLLQDSNIEDVSCDGVGIPIFIFHRNPDIGSIATNITFNSSEQLDSFIIRLAQLCGKSISVAEPLLDGSLPDGSRIQATLGTDIARRGSNFTIRKFTEEPLTPIHLMNYGTLDVSILAYLWFVVDYGRNVLVSGGTASGKTSLLNVLSLFIRPEKKIVSIEDTAELRLPHPHWVPVVARIAIGEEGKGEVDMFELLRESLRQRPDYIVVGEVRGKEAYILFQQMATGHPSLATIHAENISRLTDRLTTPPISLPAGLINILDIVVFLARMKYKNKFIRKITEIDEIVDFNADTNSPIINQIYKWNPRNDKFEVTGKSVSLKKISDFTGISEKDIKSEIERRIVVLEWMKENNVIDYRDVHKIFSLYYADPERLLTTIQGAG